ncbi:MAG: T9SS type A sorting domain-containing protein [Bacteroidales bacterium]|nr:T9SS type A sorting domain-containing protein [Bacteroidales bacterium]
MKRNLLFWATIILLAIAGTQLNAQYATCTPNPDATDPEGNGEIEPDNLPISFIGEAYDVTLTITPPPEGGGFDVTKIQIDYLENLPTGFYWDTNSGNDDDYMYTNNWYCVAVTGMPEGPAGIYDVTVYANAWIWAVFLETEAPDNPQNGGSLTAVVCNPLALDLGDDITIGLDETIDFNVDLEDDYHTYLWSDDSSEPTFAFDAAVYGPGTHQIYVTVRDTVGSTGIYAGMLSPCFKSDTINITVSDCGGFSFDLGENTSISTNHEITLDATIEGENIEYLWNDDSTNPTLTVDGSVLGEGEFTFSVTVTNGDCEFSDEITIEIVDCIDFVFELGDNTTITNTEQMTLDATVEGENIEYLWNDESSDATLIVDGSVLGVGEFSFSVTVTNGPCEFSDEITITVYDPTNINIIENSQISLYPNPNNGQFTLSLDKTMLNSKIEIIDINGQIVYSQIATSIDNKIDIRNISTGLYNIRISNKENILSLRFLMQ